ncbi:MAG TPA: DNA mismatch endonuclease Vsr, partial [Candidatus Altiarchaeales archaeon]|nr:DNA mismatch endonuclease Vsr [Candidatus Altiarchaeales archaeon]
MADNLTKEQRSHTMSKIKSKWTGQEKKIHDYLKGMKVKHKMHPKIEGNPDILLKDTKTAVFLHGCFWHKCPKCYRKPKTNKTYWISKIDNNVKRDNRNKKIVRSAGYNVIVVWEHQIKSEFDKVINR